MPYGIYNVGTLFLGDRFFVGTWFFSDSLKEAYGEAPKELNYLGDGLIQNAFNYLGGLFSDDERNRDLVVSPKTEFSFTHASAFLRGLEGTFLNKPGEYLKYARIISHEQRFCETGLDKSWLKKFPEYQSIIFIEENRFTPEDSTLIGNYSQIEEKLLGIQNDIMNKKIETTIWPRDLLSQIGLEKRSPFIVEWDPREKVAKPSFRSLTTE